MYELEAVGSVGKFLQVVSAHSRAWSQTYAGRWPNSDEEEWLPWFRGEQSAGLDTALQPKLYRPRLIKTSQLLHQEQELRLEFRRCGEQLIQERRPADKFEWYFLMAHCVVPTRLLDWTDGALVALYFAIKGRGRQGDAYGSANAAVYMIDPWWLNDFAFAEAQPSTKKRDRSSGVALSDWKEVTPWLPGELDSEGLRRKRPLAIDPSHFSRRIAAQRSHFVLFGRDTQGVNNLAQRQESRVIRIPIDVSDVTGMLRDLKTSGISESMIFPDVDGLGRELKLAFDQRCRVAGDRSNRLNRPKPVLIELRPSKVHRRGVGVFATANLKKDQWIAQGVSGSDYQHLVLWRQSSRYPAVVARKIRDFCVGTPTGFIPPAEFDFGSLSIEWYFNHSCDGNVGFVGFHE